MKTLTAYNGSDELKAKTIADYEQHIRDDDFIRGNYKAQNGNTFKGCAITCLLNPPNTPFGKVTTTHKLGEKRLGFPEWLMYVTDRYYEGHTTMKEGQNWSLSLLKAIPVGFTDWHIVKAKFATYVLKQQPQTESAKRVLGLLKRELTDNRPTIQEWKGVGAAYAAAYADASADASAYAYAYAYADAYAYAYASADASANAEQIAKRGKYLVKLFKEQL